MNNSATGAAVSPGPGKPTATLEIRRGLEREYEDVLIPEVRAALSALAPFEIDRRAVMDCRIQRRAERARTRQRIGFLDDARTFAQAIHAEFPDKMLAYNLSPSFNWDTTGMSDEEMTQFPKALGNLGYVFNFITYGGHQIDGLAAEEFAAALMQDGMLALARLQRKFRLLESPYSTPQTLVGGMRLDGALMA